MSDTQNLSYMKLLLDNCELVTEKGVLKALILLAQENPTVIEGTAYAKGTAEAINILMEKRPDLRTPAIVKVLDAIVQMSRSERARKTACDVLENLRNR